MSKTITAEHVEAYSHCPRKSFLLMTGEAACPGPHDHELAVEAQADASRWAHRDRLGQAREVAPFAGLDGLAAGQDVLADAVLEAGGLQARFDFLTRVGGASRLGAFSYEPVKVIGTRRPARGDILGLAHAGLVLAETQGRPPVSGTLVRADGRLCKVKLDGKYKEARKLIDALRALADDPADAPPVVLNRHCPSCPFRDACLREAEKADDLSLLDRMTPKLRRKYHDKGIFTVTQLSHVYRPRRGKKKAKRQVRHSLELQALAIRTGKVHVEHLPELTRSPVELFLDLEGVPDRDAYYLAGLLVCGGGEPVYESFWADDEKGEVAMWSALAGRLEDFPGVPVYHYGGYEKKAFAMLARRHGTGSGLAGRLVNVASSVYGKIYFPVRSNGLKALGRLLGAAWGDPLSSGLQSLAWRLGWEATRDERLKQSLLRYNREDCEAVRLLVAGLDRIRRDAASDPAIEVACKPQRHATETGKSVHEQLEHILKSAGMDSGTRGIRLREKEAGEGEPRKRGAPKGHLGYRRVIPSKAGKVVCVPPKRTCPKGHGGLILLDAEGMAERTITDLAFTKGGCRKTITRYEGRKARCQACGRTYDPPAITRLGNQIFGHAFRAWTVYQRVVLRLPYRIITQVTEHLFGVGMSSATPINFLSGLADHYAPTEAAMLRAILKSDFVHVDETKINIEGVNHYVWVFTDGQHVVFRMTETREADVIREVLAGYEGVLVSDFYPGYDGVPCRQQKCLVHLIRDINDDLWKSPFDKELESFAVEVMSLLVPILQAVDRYGLKAWHLRRFNKDVERFYQRSVTAREYRSEAAETYRKRFDRYRESLFTFLAQDGIPWENNMAERAIRQLAVQRKISGTFFKRSASHYLLLLAISQTCRFQGKSFLKFLLSKETDLDSFKQTRPIRYSYPVPKREAPSGDEGSATTAQTAPPSGLTSE